mmetsp:Transcript_21290/g.31106  ORF Transcript_21290/g.31106 Transcript_21290/m.31106 type:complete len:241 (-) Transcript_21290:1141-1863(-)
MFMSTIQSNPIQSNLITSVFNLYVSSQLQSNSASNNGNSSNVWFRKSSKVNKDTGLSNAINLIRAPPATTVERAKLEKLIWIVQSYLRITGIFCVVQVREENCRHDRIGSFRSKYFIGFEIGHALIRPGESAVLHDGYRGCGWSDVGRNNAALAASNNGTPVLHALGKSVVGSLCDTKSVDDVKIASLAGQRLHSILPQKPSITQQFHEDAIRLTGIFLVLSNACLMSFLSDNVEVGRGT